jgi:hypothetical protein
MPSSKQRLVIHQPQLVALLNLAASAPKGQKPTETKLVATEVAQSTLTDKVLRLETFNQQALRGSHRVFHLDSRSSQPFTA